ncbi:sigma-54-dependent transcriptional regulator [Thalassotalea ganghwensis]
MAKILVIDDRPDIRLSLVVLLEAHGYQVLEADSPQVAQMQLKQEDCALILLDMNYSLDTTSGEEGIAFLTWLNKQEVNVPVIAMTAWSNVDLVIKAMKLGAKDFVEKPWRNKQLLHAIEQQLNIQRLTLQNSQLKQSDSADTPFAYQWCSQAMKALYKKIDAIADTDVCILLTGENGTGKTELARYIHQQSNRKNQGFISVNMGAISESLFESEMFGHKKGAFTDAKSHRIGRYELAENGSLFLDEIANIPMSQQAKMLRVLESGEYEVLGSSDTQRASARIISATNGNIQELIEQKLFREDLYYRLNTIEFELPPLRERKEDIIPLAEFFIDKFCKQYHKPMKSLAPSAVSSINAYGWPGNVREMSHVIERAVLLSDQQQIALPDLSIIGSNKQSESLESGSLPMMTLAQAEQYLVEQALEQTEHNVAKAAQLVGLTKASMYRRLEKYGISKK